MPDRRLSIILIILAVAVRAAAVVALQSHTVPRSTFEHGEIAANLLSGRGFSVRFLGADGPTSQQAPMYPLLVAGAYAMGGIGTPRALLLLELGQAAIGGMLVAAVLMLAREVAPDRPRLATTAGLIAALHPTLVYAATHVQVALLAATLLTATLAWAYRAGRTGRPRDASASGLLLAALMLTDPILGLASAGVAWAVVLGLGPRRGARTVALIALTAMAGIAPWIARNASVHGELVFIKSTFGYAFWQGNCAMSEGTDKVVRASVERALQPVRGGLRGLNESLWDARHEAGYLDDVALTAADYRALGAVSEPERSRLLFRRAVAELRDEPGRYARLCLRRLRYFALFDETNPKTRNLPYRAGHLTLTLLAAWGLARARPEIRWRLGPTILTASLIALFHAMTIVSARFHVPIEPLMAVWAAGLQPRRPAKSKASGSIAGLAVIRASSRSAFAPAPGRNRKPAIPVAQPTQVIARTDEKTHTTSA
jgi:hypothetical protein